MTSSLSVVVASVNGFPWLAACLDALGDHSRDAEVIVASCTDGRTVDRIRDGWPSVRVIPFEHPTTVPALRAAGIAESTRPYVAVIEDPCVVTEGWAEGLVAAHAAGHSAVGGAIRNGAPGLGDWAGFLFEYGAYMDPRPDGEVDDLCGMNVSYDRRAVEAMADLLREARWESWLHARLRQRGLSLYATSEAPIEYTKEFRMREFTAQRFHFARAYAAQRGEDLGWKRPVYALAAAALVPLLYARIFRDAARAGRLLELFLVTPLLLVYLVATAAGEGIGYALGGGSSLRRVK